MGTEAILSHCALVTLWAAKYHARGDAEKLDWAKQRYMQSQAQVECLPRIDFEHSEELVLDKIVHSLISSTDSTLRRACMKIKNTISLASAITSEART
jgi:hypothetical protein